MEKLDVLFFGAHPDDIELSCGGTVIKLVKMDKRAGIIDLTRGELSTLGTVELRQQEVLKANNVMNIHVRENLNLPDGNIEESYTNKLKIIEVIRHYQPEIIFIPHPHDRHPDHTHASNLVREAAFYSGLEKIKTKKDGNQQKEFRPKRRIYYMQTYTFEPTFIIDITDEFNQKMESIKSYSSQFFNPDSKEPPTFISDRKFIEYLEARARFYGFQVGTEYGEPFFTEEKINLDIENLF